MEFCLCPSPPVLCLQGVLLLKVCVYGKLDAFYNCYWAYTWFDKVQSMCKGKDKGKDIPRQAEVAQGVPGRLRPQIF